MATTTNYGWTTPDDTALVKDGAAAIRTLGSSVDTTTKALNPATTLGDIQYRSATANTNTRLGVGSNGQVLSVSGGVPAWVTPASGFTFISRTSFTNQATVNIDSVFSASYRSYLVVIEDIAAATNSDNLLLLARIGSTTITSGYDGNIILMVKSANTVNGTGIASAAAFDLNSDTGNTSAEIYFNKVGNSTQNPIWRGTSFTGDTGRSAIFWGTAVSSGTVTGFQLKSASTNITGTVAVYGLAVA
jgi:hypothetical protein